LINKIHQNFKFGSVWSIEKTLEINSIRQKRKIRQQKRCWRSRLVTKEKKEKKRRNRTKAERKFIGRDKSSLTVATYFINLWFNWLFFKCYITRERIHRKSSSCSIIDDLFSQETKLMKKKHLVATFEISYNKLRFLCTNNHK